MAVHRHHRPATLHALHIAGLPQTRGLATATAAIAIVLPADPDRAVHDAYDDGRVAERVLIAARMLDIGAGISWVRTGVRDEVGRILGLPADRMVRTIVQFGLPTAAAARRRARPGRPVWPRDETVFRERWPAG